MSKKVRLKAPPGTDEANYSRATAPYKVDNDGYVEVDEEAVGPLIEKGGFILEPDPVEEAVGDIRIKHASDPAALCSHGGEEFGLEGDGSLIVPVAAVAPLRAHGFAPVPGEPIVAGDPSHDEPAAEGTTHGELTADEPAHKGPFHEEPVVPEDPIAEDPANEEPLHKAAPTKGKGKGSAADRYRDQDH